MNHLYDHYHHHLYDHYHHHLYEPLSSPSNYIIITASSSTSSISPLSASFHFPYSFWFKCVKPFTWDCACWVLVLSDPIVGPSRPVLYCRYPIMGRKDKLPKPMKGKKKALKKGQRSAAHAQAARLTAANVGKLGVVDKMERVKTCTECKTPIKKGNGTFGAYNMHYHCGTTKRSIQYACEQDEEDFYLLFFNNYK